MRQEILQIDMSALYANIDLDSWSVQKKMKFHKYFVFWSITENHYMPFLINKTAFSIHRKTFPRFSQTN